MGDNAEGNADVAAAETIDLIVATKFAVVGIKP
jgi:hypothetical protein